MAKRYSNWPFRSTKSRRTSLSRGSRSAELKRISNSSDSTKMPNTVCGMTKVLISLRVRSHNVFRKKSAACGSNGFIFRGSLASRSNPSLWSQYSSNPCVMFGSNCRRRSFAEGFSYGFAKRNPSLLSRFHGADKVQDICSQRRGKTQYIRYRLL